MHLSKAWEYVFHTSTHVFGKRKNPTNPPNSSTFDKHFGKVYAVGRMTSYQANMHVREPKSPLEELWGKKTNETNNKKGRGRYTLNVASD